MAEQEAVARKMESVHQTLLNKAYSLWGDNNLTYRNFLTKVLEELGELYFNAVITGNFNYQVCNGGFGQWHDNGYSVAIEELADFFNSLPENQTIKSVIIILENVNDELLWVDDGIKESKKLEYEYRDFFKEKLEESFYSNVEYCDQDYYKINEEVEKILEEYFKTEYEKISPEIREENT